MARNSRLLLNREQVAQPTERDAGGADFKSFGSEPPMAPQDYAASEPPEYAAPLFNSKDAGKAQRRSLSAGWSWDWIYRLGGARTIKAGILVLAAAAVAALGFGYPDEAVNLYQNVKASLFGPSAEQSVAEDETTPAQEATPAVSQPPYGGTSYGSTSYGSKSYGSTSPFGQSTVGVRSGSPNGRTSPSRDDIALALRTARQGPADGNQPQYAAPASRTLNTDDVTVLLKRARVMIGIGDIVAARLLLQRAANAQDAGAALMLAQTYDPAVLGKPDARTITPDPDMARSWYQRAAELGSPDAKQRLAQMQN
jgi:TPR repeat protein